MSRLHYYNIHINIYKYRISYIHCYHSCDNIDWEYENVLSLADTVNLSDKPKPYANASSI